MRSSYRFHDFRFRLSKEISEMLLRRWGGLNLLYQSHVKIVPLELVVAGASEGMVKSKLWPSAFRFHEN